nr:Crp/Fnr family transcriptional regulator [Rubellimicrobium arenae]
MRSYGTGEAVARAGDRLEVVATVVSGSATLSRGLEDGRTQIVGLLLPANLLGRPGGQRLAHDVVATTPLTLCTIRPHDLAGLRASQPALDARFLEMTIADLEAARNWMTVLGRKTARERVASFLMMLAHREVVAGADPNRPVSFDLPLTREQAADYLGLTIETVSRQLTGLKRDGVIELPTKRGVKVLDLERLLIETGDDADGGLPT